MIPQHLIEDALAWRTTRQHSDLKELYDCCDALTDEILAAARRAWLLGAREGKLDEAQLLIGHRCDGLSLSVMASILLNRANLTVGAEAKREAYRAVTEIPEHVPDPRSPQGTEGQAYLDNLRGMAYAEIGDRLNAERLLHSANRGFRMLGIDSESTAVALDNLEADPDRRAEKLKLRLREAKNRGDNLLVAHIADDLVRLGSELLGYALINDSMQDMAPGVKKDATASAIEYVCNGVRTTQLKPIEEGPPGLMVSVYMLHLLEQALAQKAAFRYDEAEVIAHEIINYNLFLAPENKAPTQIIGLVRARAAIMLGRFEMAEEMIEAASGPELTRGPFYIACLRAEISLRRGEQVDRAAFIPLIANLEQRHMLLNAANTAARVMPDALLQISGMHTALRQAAMRISSAQNWPEKIRLRVKGADEDLAKWQEYVDTHPERSFAQSWLITQ